MMRRLCLAAAAAAPLILAVACPAEAQVNAANGFPVGGGFHRGGGGFGGWGGRGIINRGVGWQRPGGHWRGPGWRGPGWRGPEWRGGYWQGSPRYRYAGAYRYGGLAAGLATAATLGALAPYPSYPAQPYYGPAYPVYPAYQVVPSAGGGRCSTPVRLCTLYEPAPIGMGCSCSVPGGRARGSVVP